MGKAATVARPAGPTTRTNQATGLLASRGFAPPRAPEAERREQALRTSKSATAGPSFSFGTLPIQAKLVVGAVDDPLEREAGAVADHVMRMPDPALSIGVAPLQISRKCEACEKEDEDEEKLQMKPASGSLPQTSEPPAIVHTVLRSPGRPLDATSRAYFEPRFAHDFSGVRVHTDGRAAKSARSIGASAYTAGSNIAFAAGRFSPATSSGRRLLAHELTHVVQQRALNPGGAFPEAAIIQRDVNSDFYKQGYQDGLAGKEAQPALVWDQAALDDYNAGYAKGHSEFIQQQPSGESAVGLWPQRKRPPRRHLRPPRPSPHQTSRNRSSKPTLSPPRRTEAPRRRLLRRRRLNKVSIPIPLLISKVTTTPRTAYPRNRRRP